MGTSRGRADGPRRFASRLGRRLESNLEDFGSEVVLRTHLSNRIPGLNPAGDHHPRIDPAQVQFASSGRVHEARRVRAEALKKLGAARMRLRRDLDDGGSDGEPRAGRKIRLADIEIDV